jgi:hypothetical protein
MRSPRIEQRRGAVIYYPGGWRVHVRRPHTSVSRMFCRKCDQRVEYIRKPSPGDFWTCFPCGHGQFPKRFLATRIERLAPGDPEIAEAVLRLIDFLDWIDIDP